MGLNYPAMSEHYAPAYTVSASPFVTGSTISLGQIVPIYFSHVSKFITVKNITAGTTLAVAFTENGLKPENRNYFTLGQNETYSADLRLGTIFLSGSVGNPTYELIAGLTSIPMRNFLVVTASNGFDGVG